MSAITVRLPDSLHQHLRNAAAIDGVSVNQFISLAVAEKLSALQTYDLIARCGQRGSREAFLEALASIPDAPPELGDEIPTEYRRKPEESGADQPATAPELELEGDSKTVIVSDGRSR